MASPVLVVVQMTIVSDELESDGYPITNALAENMPSMHRKLPWKADHNPPFRHHLDAPAGKFSTISVLLACSASVQAGMTGA